MDRWTGSAKSMISTWMDHKVQYMMERRAIKVLLVLSHLLRFVPPKFNTIASIRKDLNWASVGEIENVKSNLMATSTCKILQVIGVRIAEPRWLKERNTLVLGLNCCFGAQMGFLVHYLKLQGEDELEQELQLIIWEIKEINNRVRVVTFSLMCRKGNGSTYELAKSAASSDVR